MVLCLWRIRTTTGMVSGFRSEVIHMEAKPMDIHITKTTIDGTLYIVESVPAEAAKDVIYVKIKRLILGNVKVSENSKVS